MRIAGVFFCFLVFGIGEGSNPFDISRDNLNSDSRWSSVSGDIAPTGDAQRPSTSTGLSTGIWPFRNSSALSSSLQNNTSIGSNVPSSTHSSGFQNVTSVDSGIPSPVHFSSFQNTTSTRSSITNTSTSVLRPLALGLPVTNASNFTWAATQQSVSSVTLPATGSGLPYASACASLQKSWSEANRAWSLSNITTTSYSTTIITYTRTADVTYSCYTTLCDGHCRIDGLITTNITMATRASTSRSLGPLFPISSPACSIHERDCTSMLVSYMCATSLWSKPLNTNSMEPNRHCSWATITTPTASPIPPNCHAPGLAFGSNTITNWWRGGSNCGKCMIFAGHRQAHAQLIFFPPSNVTTKKNMCATTITDTPVHGFDRTPILTPIQTNLPHETAGQGSAVVDGTTYWANSAYIRFSRIEALDDCGNVGPALTSALVTLRSSQVLSNRGVQAYNAYSFNFADMVGLKPYIAQRGENHCWEDLGNPPICDIIDDQDPYLPQIAMPQQVRTLRKEWESCDISWVGISDPPIALQTIRRPFPPSSTLGGPSGEITPTRLPDSTPAAPGASLPGPGEPSRTVVQPSLMPSSGPGAPGQPAPGPSQPSRPSSTPLTTIGSQTVIADPSNTRIIIGTQTLSAGSPGITVGGIPISLIRPGNSVVIGDSTIGLQQDPSGAVAEAVPNVAAILTLGGTVLTAGAAGLTIGSTVLSVGGPALTTTGRTISLAASGVVIVENGATKTVPYSAVPGGDLYALLNGVKVSTLADGRLVVGGVTLSKGSPPLTTNGRTVRVGDEGVEVEGPEGRTTVPIATKGGGSSTASSSSKVKSDGGSGDRVVPLVYAAALCLLCTVCSLLA